MAHNQLCGLDNRGRGAYTAAGITKLCEGLKGSVVTSLKCAAARAFAFVSAPIDTPPSRGSLGNNRLCGVDFLGNGTYTTEGITKLFEALRGSTVTSLEYRPPALEPAAECLLPVSTR